MLTKCGDPSRTPVSGVRNYTHNSDVFLCYHCYTPDPLMVVLMSKNFMNWTEEISAKTWRVVSV